MSALEIFASVLKREMSLGADQIYFWDQKIIIPKDNRLYVAISELSCKPFSNIRETVAITGGLTERLTTNFKTTLQVDILSRSAEARTRKEEVILALNSTYSIQQQEANSMMIAKISSGFNNLSEIDGAAIPYRFNILVNIQYAVQKTKAIDYYDDFTDEVLTDA